MNAPERTDIHSRKPIWLGIALGLALVLLGCETTFEPFSEGGLDFSILGFLDAERDTQFVRIEPLQDGIFLGSTDQPFDDIDVTLEHVSSGHRMVMKDSIFWFSESAVHNFWTPLRPTPGETYRLTARYQDGSQSLVDVTMPDSFPLPSLINPPECLSAGCEAEPIEIHISGIDNLAAIIASYRFIPPNDTTGCELIRVSYLEEAIPAEPGYVIRINWLRDMQRLVLEGFETLDVWVAAGDPEWPDVTALDFETLLFPQTVSNIDNGVGFFGGITSKTLHVFGDARTCR